MFLKIILNCFQEQNSFLGLFSMKVLHPYAQCKIFQCIFRIKSTAKRTLKLLVRDGFSLIYIVRNKICNDTFLHSDAMHVKFYNSYTNIHA